MPPGALPWRCVVCDLFEAAFLSHEALFAKYYKSLSMFACVVLFWSGTGSEYRVGTKLSYGLGFCLLRIVPTATKVLPTAGRDVDAVDGVDGAGGGAGGGGGVDGGQC